MRSNQRQAGFTLIEMLVSLGLTLILMTIVLGIWRNMSNAIVSATEAVGIAAEARLVNQMIDETRFNVHGSYPLLAGVPEVSAGKTSADLGGVDSYQMGNLPSSVDLQRLDFAILNGVSNSSQQDLYYTRSNDIELYDPNALSAKGLQELFACFRGLKWASTHESGSGLVADKTNATASVLSFQTTGNAPVEYVSDYYSAPDTTNTAYQFVTVSGPRRWEANTPVYYKQTVIPYNLSTAESNGYEKGMMYQAINSQWWGRDTATALATTGSSEPDWPTKYGATVQDGEVTWMCIPPYLHISRFGAYNSHSGFLAWIYQSGKDASGNTFPKASISAAGVGEPFEGWGPVGMDDVCLFPLDSAGNTINAADLMSKYPDRGWGWVRDTFSRQSIAARNLVDFKVQGYTPPASAEGTLVSLTPEILASDDNKYTGFAGRRPQGTGAVPSSVAMNKAGHPRVIRVDYKIMGNINPRRSEQGRPQSYTYIYRNY